MFRLLATNMTAFRRLLSGLMLALPGLLAANDGHAFQWSSTELQLQAGYLDIPDFAGGGDDLHLVYTFQHANRWKYGDNFVFVDVIDAQRSGFQDFDVYGEWYSNFSLGRIKGKRIGGGFVSDIGFITTVQHAVDAKVWKYGAGVRLALELPGFAFANLDTLALFDAGKGVDSGGAPKEDNTVVVDFNFGRPFRIGESRFSIEGHIEYRHGPENELGQKAKSWVLAQPQLRWRPTERIAVGIEYQFWLNKLGKGATDESAVQALLVWKF